MNDWRNVSRIVLGMMVVLAMATSCVSAFRDEVDLSGDSDTDVAALEDYLERYPLGRQSDSVRFQLAMLYLSAENRSDGSSAARSLLWQLAGNAADPYREGAERVLELLLEVERLRAAASVSARAVDRLSLEMSRLRQAVELSRGQIAEKGEDAERLEEKVESLLGQLNRVKEQNAAREEQIDRLAMELRELKRIDTGQVP